MTYIPTASYPFDRYSLPDTAHTDDVEWDTDSLPSNVTENFTPSGSAIDPYDTFSTGNPRRSINPEWMQRHYTLQPPANSTANIMYAVTLATDTFVQMPLMMSMRWGGASGSYTPRVRVGLCTRSGSAIVLADATYLSLSSSGTSNLTFEFVHTETGQTTQQVSQSADYNENGIVNCHLGISKRGLEYDFWISTVRNNWQRVDEVSKTRLGGASVFNGVFLEVTRNVVANIPESVGAIGPIRFRNTDKGPFG